MSRGTADTPADPVEDYLDRLLVTLSGSPRQVRHTLGEVEAHLHDAVAEGVAAGLAEPEAQAQAVARMGPVHGVTGRGQALARPSLALARRLALTAALIGGAGFLAIGAAGLVARLLLTVKGDQSRPRPGRRAPTPGRTAPAGSPGTRHAFVRDRHARRPCR